MIQALVRKAFGPAISDAVANSLAMHLSSRPHQTDEAIDGIGRLRGMAIATGLRKLFTDKHFSICQLDALIATAEIVPDGELMRILRPLHCVDFCDMKPELREEIFGRIMAMFNASSEVRV